MPHLHYTEVITKLLNNILPLAKREELNGEKTMAAIPQTPYREKGVYTCLNRNRGLLVLHSTEVLGCGWPKNSLHTR